MSKSARIAKASVMTSRLSGDQKSEREPCRRSGADTARKSQQTLTQRLRKDVWTDNWPAVRSLWFSFLVWVRVVQGSPKVSLVQATFKHLCTSSQGSLASFHSPCFIIAESMSHALVGSQGWAGSAELEESLSLTSHLPVWYKLHLHKQNLRHQTLLNSVCPTDLLCSDIQVSAKGWSEFKYIFSKGSCQEPGIWTRLSQEQPTGGWRFQALKAVPKGMKNS